MFFNVGGLELLVIAMVALIVVGPEQLPGLMRKIGKYARQARSMSSALRDEFMSGIEEVQDIAKPESWMGTGSDDDPIVPKGFADRVDAESTNGSKDRSSGGDGGDEAVEPEATEVAEAKTDGAASSDTNGAEPSTTSTTSKPRISQVAQANSSQAVVEAAAETAAAETAAAETAAVSESGDEKSAVEVAAESRADEAPAAPMIPGEAERTPADRATVGEPGADDRTGETTS